MSTESIERSPARLLLVGASGLALEASNVARALSPQVELRILDDDATRWGSDLGGIPIVGGLDSIVDHLDQPVVVCVGKGIARREIVERIRRRGTSPRRFATLVHPSIAVPADCSIGAGSVLMEGVVLTADVTVGRHVVVMPHVTLTHGNTIGDHATLCAGVALGGDVTVGSGAYLGMRASVRERVQIGRDAVLGMGSTLVRDLPAGETWVGTPACPMNSPVSFPRMEALS